MASGPVRLAADYLVVGAGAMGLAFADEIIATDKSITIVMVDTRAKPGGHWNDAYDFVTLHQPAAYYGVNSEVLGSGGTDLASKFQILAYFEKVVKKLEATGRLSFYPQCKYMGETGFSSLLDGDLKYEVDVRRKVVDASYLTTSVPATTPPRYTVGPGIHLVPINGLARLERAWEQYVVIGAGKTGIDAVLHLLGLGLPPAAIVWVVPNDPWMTNRDYLQVLSLASPDCSLPSPDLPGRFSEGRIVPEYCGSGGGHTGGGGLGGLLQVAPAPLPLQHGQALREGQLHDAAGPGRVADQAEMRHSQ
jgi:hypothetical protein